MANGPPTPPPTTDIEIQDATKDAEPIASASTMEAPPVEPSQAEPQQQQPQQPQHHHQDAFQSSFTSSIAPLVAAQKWYELSDVAELADLTGEEVPTRMLVVAPLVLAYLINDELPSAKFALNRLSNRLMRMPIAASLARLLASVTERQYRDVYERVNEIPTDGDLNGTLHPEFGAAITAMIDAFSASFRSRTFTLLSKAYSEISLPLAQTYLGMSADTLLSAAENHGWKFDSSTQILSPIVTTERATRFDTSTLTSFNYVADSVCKLEM